MFCKTCDDFICRCDSCFALAEVDDQWYCDEQQEFCKNITTCHEFNDNSGCDKRKEEI